MKQRNLLEVIVAFVLGEKYYCNIEHVGNTVSSTIPIGLCLALEDGSLKPGMKVLSVAQGLGYTWGGMVLFF